MLFCVIGATCCALAYAIELSDRMLAASARFTGAAMLALIRDICSRSGSCSPTCDSSSSLVRAERRGSTSLVTFVIVNLLFRGRSTARFRLRASAPLNDAAIAGGGARRHATVAGRNGGVHVGNNVDVAAPIMDELVYHLMHCLQSFYVIASSTCQPPGFAE